MLFPIIRKISIVCNTGVGIPLMPLPPGGSLVEGKFVASIPNTFESEIQSLRINYHHLRKIDRVSLLAAFCASRLIIKEPKQPLLISIGSSRGATISLEDSMMGFARDGTVALNTSPITTLGNISASVASLIERNTIPVDHSVTCSSALSAIANALAWLRSGMAEAAIVGGAEAPISSYTLAQIAALGISQQMVEEEFPCKPFSLEGQRNTFMLGEGAGLAYIEMDEAQESDLVIESIGFGFCDPPSLTGIDSNGGSLLKSMKMALDNMHSSQPVDLILAHAPGTLKGDKAESNAIETVFKETAPYIFSSKWMCGHTYAASAMMNLHIADKLLNGEILPEMPFPVFVNSGRAAPKRVNKIMINASGFGGNSMSLVISKGLLH